MTQIIRDTKKKNNQDTKPIWFFCTSLYIVLDYSRLYETFHLSFIRPMMLISLVLILFLIFSGEFFRIKNKQIRTIWFFIILLACYIPFAKNNHLAYVTTKGQLLYMPFILSVIVCIYSFDRLRKFIFICIGVSIYVALYAISHSGHGPGNYLLDENDMSLYLNMWIPFCYFLFLAEKKLIPKIYYASGLILGLLAVVVSFSRGGFIGLLGMTAIAWLVSKKKIISLVIISLLALTMIFFGDEAYWEEMSTVTDTKEATADARLLTWGAGWRMFLDYPFGVGGNNFPVRFPEYQSAEHGRGMWGRVAHSLWFTLLPEVGIIGIFIYFSLLYYNLKDIFLLRKLSLKDDNEVARYLHYLSLAFLASLAGYFASGTFISVLYYAHYWYLTGVIVAAKRIGNELIEDEGQQILTNNNGLSLI